MGDHERKNHETKNLERENGRKKKPETPSAESVPTEGVTFDLSESSLERHAGLLANARSESERASLALQLQQSYGNAYVQRLLGSIAAQAKLSVSTPGDASEREANRVADTVMHAGIQRETTPEEEEEVQASPGDVQTPDVSDGLESQINATRGGGQPLSDSTRAFFEPKLGHEFSNVNIHTDTEANALSHQLSAEAFTTGPNIFFKEGAYQPDTDKGKWLLAHELTHVVQQDAAKAIHRVDGDEEAEGEEGEGAETAVEEPEMSVEVPDLTQATYDQVEQAIANDEKQEAIDLILGELKESKFPNLIECEGNTITYNPDVEGEGLCSWQYDPPTNTLTKIWVEIGDDAFTSVSWLYSSMSHKYQHVNQAIADPREAGDNAPMAEFGAYSWEVYHAAETGVIDNPAGLQDVGSRLTAQGWDLMTEDEQDANQEVYDGALEIIRDAIGDPSWEP